MQGPNLVSVSRELRQIFEEVDRSRTALQAALETENDDLIQVAIEGLTRSMEVMAAVRRKQLSPPRKAPDRQRRGALCLGSEH